MAQPPMAHDLNHFLLEEDLIPEECAHVEVHYPVDGMIQIHYTVNVTEDRLVRFHRALQRYMVHANLVNAVDPPRT